MCTQMNGSSPLCLASKNGHVKAVAAIFSLISKEMHERMLELVDQVEKRTPLLWAAANGKTSVFLFLLKCGANYLKRDKMKPRCNLDPNQSIGNNKTQKGT